MGPFWTYWRFPKTIREKIRLKSLIFLIFEPAENWGAGRSIFDFLKVNGKNAEFPANHFELSGILNIQKREEAGGTLPRGTLSGIRK